MSKRTIYFRADGDSSIGLGHVIRSCSLADMLKVDFDCHFIIREPLPALKSEILKSCVSVHELPGELSFESESDGWIKQLSGTEIIVLDGYHFTTAYQQLIKDTGCILVCIDDLYKIEFVSDAIINHAPGVNTSNYITAPYTSILHGVNFLLSRKAFLDAAGARKKRHTNRRLFICFGGADYNNITQKVLDAALRSEHFDQIQVVTGEAYLHEAVLKAYVEQQHHRGITLHSKLSADEMVEIMSSCDIGIAPCSGILFELCCIGMGLISGYFVDNQEHLYEHLNKAGVFTGLGNFNLADTSVIIDKIGQLDLETVNKQITHQQQLIDGRSADRLRKAFIKLSKEYLVDIRAVSMEDATTLYEWANDPVTRLNAINQEPIIWDNHIKWLSRKVGDSDNYMFIFAEKLSGRKIGLVRFDSDRDEYLISYLVDKDQRGNGWGEVIMKLAIKELVKKAGKVKLKAMVKEANIASSQVFINLAFHSQPPVIIDYNKYYIYAK